MLHAPAIQLQFGRPKADQPVCSAPDVVAEVRRVLEVPDEQLDYAKAKIAFDALVDPEFDQAWVHGELDRLTDKALELTRGDTRSSFRLGGVRTLLYESGPWNDHRPFSYDRSDPTGRLARNKLLHNYLNSRRGQCVSMPVLFLILASRLGQDVALASAPEHVFVRYTDRTGRVHNLETTSGGHPARDEWYRHAFPITDRSVQSGIYLRTLSVREGIAVMASTVIEHLNAQRRFHELEEVCEVILRHHPRDVHTMLWLGSTCGKLLDRLRADHPDPRKLPPELQAHATKLMERNRRCFEAAEQLGWIPFE